MQRRDFVLAGGSFFAGAGAGLYGCAAATDAATDDDPMTKTFGTPPWHLWGNAETHVYDIPSAGSVSRTSRQLAQVKYKRPDTWDFLLSAKITQYDDHGIQPVSRIVNVLFELQLGLGLGTQIINPFCRFDFELGSVGGPELNLQRWTTQVAQPLTARTSTVQSFCDGVVAEQIQASAIIVAAGSGNGFQFTLELGAQFAPRSHIRPEWFKGQFPGGEDEGK